MKKTIYFKQICNYGNTIRIMDELILEKEKYIKTNLNIIAKIESESVRVDHIGQNHAVCIIKLTYFEK